MVNYLDDYMRSKNELSLTTQKEYKNTLLLFYKYMENNKFDSINKYIYDSFIIELENKNYKINSINKYISIINNYFNYLLKNEYIDEKIYLKKFKNKVDGNKKIILKSEFIKTINLIEVNFPNSKRDIMIIYLLFNTQLKLNEILSLKKLDFKDNFQFVKVNNKIISLDKDVVKYLTNYKIDNESYLFTNNNGNVLSRQSVWKFIKKYNCKLSLNLSIDILNRSYKINKMLESFNKEEL